MTQEVSLALTSGEEERFVSVIKDMIVTLDEQDLQELVERLETEHQDEILLQIMRNPNHLINVRAHAARLLFSRATSAELFETYRDHPSSLVRHGVLLGLEEAEDFERISHFVEDASSAVAQEAVEILEGNGVG